MIQPRKEPTIEERHSLTDANEAIVLILPGTEAQGAQLHISIKGAPSTTSL